MAGLKTGSQRAKTAKTLRSSSGKKRYRNTTEAQAKSKRIAVD